MTIPVPKTNSAAPVTGAHLVPVLPPEGTAGNPVSQAISEVVRVLFTQAYQDKLTGIEAGAEVNLTGNDLRAAIDTATGSTVWRSAHTVLRTAVQVRDLLDGLLGTGWRTSGGGGGGITLDQAIDGVGAALAALSEFSYSASSNTFTFTIQANSVTAAMARATSATHRREWQNRLGIPDDWSEIPNSTPMALGKVVEHGGAYFGCINAHNKGSTGPDGDAANWVLLSNWRGDWTNAWYPVGAFVSRAGSPYVAVQAVVLNDPAPDASNNVKWLQLGASPPTVINVSADTAIPASADGDTYRVTGSTTRTITLPDPSAISVGFRVAVVNGSNSTDHTIARQGAGQTIEGGNTLTLPSGESVTLQLVNANEWELIADTQKGGSSFQPSKVNLYDAVKAIFSHNPSVTPDDADSELDFSPGAAGAIADDSILPIKARSSTAAFKKDWRDRLEVVHTALRSTTLPAVSGYSVGRDFVVLGRSSTDTDVGFRDISDPSTELTEAVSGDVFWLQNSGWTRVGNIREGSPVLRARISAIEAKTDRLTVFAQADLSPRGISGNDFPAFMALHLAGKIDPRNIAQIQVFIGGSPVATVNTSSLLTPFNQAGIAGGVINLGLGSTARANLKGATPPATQFVAVQIYYKFEGTSLAGTTEPDEIDTIRFGTNNNAYLGTERRFEHVVGASPAILPVGSYELEVVGDMGTASQDRRVAQRILLSSLSSSAQNFFLRADGGDEAQIALSYVPTTRTLTYAFRKVGGANNISLESLKAIGQV